VGENATLLERTDGLTFTGPGGVAWSQLRCGLSGAFQRTNTAVALTVLALARARWPCSPGAVRAGLAGVRWPGRLAVLGEAPLVVADGAHNPAGIEALVRELPALVGERPLTLVFAVMADKAWRAMLERLVPCARRAVVTRVGRRGLDTATLAAGLAGRLPAEVVVDPRSAICRAVELAGREGAVVVTGSLFLVGEAYAALASGGPLFEPFQGWGDGGTQTAP
jgi:dihydrofolate synthase/folylpolyglutamate synthase